MLIWALVYFKENCNPLFFFQIVYYIVQTMFLKLKIKNKKYLAMTYNDYLNCSFIYSI